MNRPGQPVAGAKIRVKASRDLAYPMIGTGQSLNVAVAGSLVLYRLAGLS